MAKDKFLLVSLEEEKSKKLAQVLSSDTARKILDYLAEKPATESELSQNLVLPISTVHYNVQQLVDASLVVSEEFTYSQKGREVSHYKLANKYIIIAPKGSAFKDSLKRFLPAVLSVGAVALAIQLFSPKTIITKSAEIVAGAPAPVTSAQIATASSPAAGTAQQIINISQPNIALWFLLGGMLAIIIYLLADYIYRKI